MHDCSARSDKTIPEFCGVPTYTVYTQLICFYHILSLMLIDNINRLNILRPHVMSHNTEIHDEPGRFSRKYEKLLTVSTKNLSAVVIDLIAV